MAVTTIYAQPGQILNLGRVGSGNQTVIKFDLDGWYTTLEAARTGGASYSLQLVYMIGGPIVRQTIPFTWSTVYDESRTPKYEITWEIDSTLTLSPGSGSCQILFTTGEDTYLTYLFQTVVTRSVVDFASLTDTEVSTYSQWLYVLQNALNQANGLGVTSEAIPFDQDPSVIKITDQTTGALTLDFSLPVAKPFYIKKLYNNLAALKNDANNASGDVEPYGMYSLRSYGDVVSVSDLYRGFLYMRVADLSTTYVISGEIGHIQDNLPAEPVADKLYIADTAINESSVVIPIYDIVSYVDGEWTTVYQFIADLYVVGPGAGFGTVSATVDANVGTPGVEVTTSGPDTAKNIQFAFSNLKGTKGDTGNAAGFGTVSATVDSNVGTPNVQVTASGPNTAKNFAFAFTNMKGETGNAAGFGTVSAQVDNTVGTPSVQVTTSGPNTAKNIEFAFSNLKGEKGDTGSAINVIGHVNTLADIPSGTYHNGDGYLVGTQTPYTLYVYYDNQWNNQGQLGGASVDINTTTHSLILSI